MGLNTDIRNISNTLQKSTQKTEKKAIKDLENKYLILDILKDNIQLAQENGLNIFDKLDREAIEQGTIKSLTRSEYYKSEKITGYLIHNSYYKIYLELQKEKRLKEKSIQTVTREETPKKEEAPKEAQTVQTVQTIDYKKLLQGLFIVSTGIVLIPLYICITITKNLK
jgi:inactivated superfamily I helicase